MDDSRYRKGDRVEVLYHKEEPSQARINDFKEMYVVWLAAFFAGFMCLAIPFAMIWWHNRKASRT